MKTLTLAALALIAIGALYFWKAEEIENYLVTRFNTPEASKHSVIEGRAEAARTEEGQTDLSSATIEEDPLLESAQPEPQTFEGNTFFIVEYHSVVSEDGVFGLVPGTEVQVIDLPNENEVIVESLYGQLSLPVSKISNEIDVVMAAVESDRHLVATVAARAETSRDEYKQQQLELYKSSSMGQIPVASRNLPPSSMSSSALGATHSRRSSVTWLTNSEGRQYRVVRGKIMYRDQQISSK